MSVPRRYVQKWAPWAMTPSRNAWPWTRLPMSRPCMSVMATTIVSIWPSRTISSSSTRRGCFAAWPGRGRSSVVSARRRSAGMGCEGRPVEPAGPRMIGPGLRQAGAARRAPRPHARTRARARSARPRRPSTFGPWKRGPRPAEVVDEEQDDDPDHERPGDVARRREARTGPSGRRPRRPRPRRPASTSGRGSRRDALSQSLRRRAEVDADAVGGVQEDRADRGDDHDRGAGRRR